MVLTAWRGGKCPICTPLPCPYIAAPHGYGTGDIDMRLWSLHPSLLDRQGLVACWREALLAQAVLLGRTRGYTAHPQLERFKAHPQPTTAIGAYLAGLHAEAVSRQYRFDAARIVHPPKGEIVTDGVEVIRVTFGQLDFELSHLRTKLAHRSPEFLNEHSASLGTTHAAIPIHPLFMSAPGPIASWERSETPPTGPK